MILLTQILACVVVEELFIVSENSPFVCSFSNYILHNTSMNSARLYLSNTFHME